MNLFIFDCLSFLFVYPISSRTILEMIYYRKKYTRRKNLDEMLQEHPLCVQPIRLTRRIPQVFRKLTGKAPANVTSSSQDLLSFETFGGLSPVCESTSTITEETDRGSGQYK